MPAGSIAVKVNGPVPVIRPTIFSWSPPLAGSGRGNIRRPQSVAPWLVPCAIGRKDRHKVIRDAGWRRAAVVAVVDVAAEVDSGLGWVDRLPRGATPRGKAQQGNEERRRCRLAAQGPNCPASEADGAEAERKRTAYDIR
jgi:hypothetical protein